MKLTKEKKVHIIYGTVLSALLVITAICFIVGCISIYMSGVKPFTAESIGRTFSNISVPVIITVIAVVGGIVLHFVLPLDKEKVKAATDKKIMLRRLSSRASLAAASDEVRGTVVRERQIRKALVLCNVILIVLGSVLALAYILNPGNFSGDDYNGRIAFAAIVVLACLLPAAVLAVVRIYVDSASISSELEAMKSIVAEQKGKDVTPDGSVECPVCKKISGFTEKNRKWIGVAVKSTVAVLSVVFILVGVLGGGLADVVGKAINICKECIGLG